MIFAEPCAMPALVASKELLAELTRRPSTSAAREARTPLTTLMVSFDASFRWWPGRRFLSHMPSSPPRKMHPAQIKAVVREVMVGAGSEILRKTRREEQSCQRE